MNEFYPPTWPTKKSEDLDERPLGDKLCIRWPWRLLVNKHPFRMWLDLVLLTLGVMWMNDLLIVHGRILHPDEQWLAPQMYFAFALAIATLAAMLRGLPWQYFPGWLWHPALHLALPLIGLGMAVGHVQGEWNSTPAIGPNWLYHNLFIYPFLGYLFGILLIAVGRMFFRKQAWTEAHMWGGLVVVAACVGLCIWAVMYDHTHQFAPSGISKHELANPAHPWQDGLIPQGIRWLQAWWAVNVAPLF